MPVLLHKPDNVLKRAQEFIDVGREDRALEALANLIKNKPHKIWQKTPEKILFDYFNKFLELCVQLRKSDIAKEGLYHYRNICQQVNVNALETVFRNFLKNAEEKTAKAAKESNVKIDIEDLDVIQSPEELLLNAVSGEVEKNNSILMPWLKFLWEAYRQCLDLLRNNNLVQNLYHDIANQTFQFCLTYSRKTEFKKISENLRNHILFLQKQHNSTIAIDLNNPETQQMHLNTRFNQLDIAITMELWQEAFKIVQDIFGLMQISKKQVKAPVRANYYKKLALVFWKAENNHLFHACALHRLYVLLKDSKKNFTIEDSQKMCTLILVATLSIPIPPPKNDIEKLIDNNDKTRKLASLLGMSTQPSRQTLINDLVTNNIVANVPLELQNLYNWLETDFHPLKLVERVNTSLTYINEKCPDLDKYIPFLQEVTLFKLLQQVAQAFESITFERFCKLSNFLGPQEIERFIVKVAKYNDIQVRIDHKKELLCFGTDYSISERDDTMESPQLQPLPTEMLRFQLMSFGRCLDEGMCLINPPESLKRIDTEQIFWVKKFKEDFHENFIEANQWLEAIEARKKAIEDLHKKEKLKPKFEVKETIRKEFEDRDKDKSTVDGHVIKKVEVKVIKTAGPPPEPSLMQELEDRRRNEEKMNQELQARLKSQYRKIDHFARAIQQEESELLEEHIKNLMIKRRSEWESLEKERVSKDIVMFQFGLKEKERLERIKPDIDAILNELKEIHRPRYEEDLANFEEELILERERRLKERAFERKQERKIKFESKRREKMMEEQQLQLRRKAPVEEIKSDVYVPPSRIRQNDFVQEKPSQDGFPNREPHQTYQSSYQPKFERREPEQKYYGNSTAPRTLTWKKIIAPINAVSEAHPNTSRDMNNVPRQEEDHRQDDYNRSNANEWRTQNRKYTNRNY